MTAGCGDGEGVVGGGMGLHCPVACFQPSKYTLFHALAQASLHNIQHRYYYPNSTVAALGLEPGVEAGSERGGVAIERTSLTAMGTA